MTFWIIIGTGTVLALLWTLRPLLGGGPAAESRAAHDRQVYRDQLAEIDRDLARGALTAEEAEASRVEIGRRLLGADDRDPAPVRAPKWLSRAAALGVSAGSAGLAVALYLSLGLPGLPDQPLAERRASRPTQAAVEALLAGAPPGAAAPADPDRAREAELLAELQRVLATRPDDLRGHRLLAASLARTGRFAEAHVAQARVLVLLGADVTGKDYGFQAELMILAANGYVSPEAESALARALELDPKDPPSRYYAGLALAQNGQPDRAYNLWFDLAVEGPPDAPWVAAIREQLPPIAATLGRPLPGATAAPLPGPDTAAVEAARDMTPEERAAMIRGMVDQLSARLAGEGGTPEEWARLIGALSVLGETDRAKAALADAEKALAGQDAALEVIRAAARDAGVAP